MEYITWGVVIFFIINLVNVGLMTTKSILTIKSTKLIASCMNAVAYGFYALIVKSMMNIETEVVIVCTVLANLIAVYFSMWLLDKLKKDRLWKISIVTDWKNSGEITKGLIENGIGYYSYNIYTEYGTSVNLDIFSKSQKESEIIKNIVSDFDIKYHIIELGKSL